MNDYKNKLWCDLKTDNEGSIGAHEVIMILNEIDESTDKFTLDEEGFYFAFPCCVCIYRNNSFCDEPCIQCGHNLK